MSYNARRLADASIEPFAWEVVGTRATTRPQPAAGVSHDGPELQARIATLEREAFAKGYAQGERGGAEAAATRAEGMLRRLGQTIEELAALRGEMIRRTERQTVQLVLAMAERVVLREVSLDRSLLVGMARAALDRLGEYGSATIRLHPDDYQAISAKGAIDTAPLAVVADPVVNRGGCLVQSDFGFMDVSPETQFRELARVLLSDSDTPHANVEPANGIALR